MLDAVAFVVVPTLVHLDAPEHVELARSSKEIHVFAAHGGLRLEASLTSTPSPLLALSASFLHQRARAQIAFDQNDRLVLNSASWRMWRATHRSSSMDEYRARQRGISRQAHLRPRPAVRRLALSSSRANATLKPGRADLCCSQGRRHEIVEFIRLSSHERH